MSTDDVRISIVIRTYNEPRELQDTLDSIRTQETSESFEVVFVDSGSKEATLSVIHSYLDRYRGQLIQIKSSEFTFGHALNIGIRHAKGELIVVLSSHCPALSESWLSNLVRHLDPSGSVAAVYGKQRTDPWTNPFIIRTQEEYFGDLLAEFTFKSRARVHYSNANGAFLRSRWEEEAFDEDLPFSEDQVWALHQLQKGFTIVYEPLAPVLHGHVPTIKDAYSVMYKASRARLALQKIESDLTTPSDSRSILQLVLTDIRNVLNERPSYIFFYAGYKFAELIGRIVAEFHGLLSDDKIFGRR